MGRLIPTLQAPASKLIGKLRRPATTDNYYFTIMPISGHRTFYVFLRYNAITEEELQEE